MLVSATVLQASPVIPPWSLVRSVVSYLGVVDGRHPGVVDVVVVSVWKL